MKKKTWVKSKQIIVRVGDCKYCGKEIINTDSFVVFATKQPAHYECMKIDDDKRSESNGE